VTWRIVLGAYLLFLLGPLALVVLFSFGSSPLIGFPMGAPTLDWYRGLLLDAGFRAAFRTSLAVAVLAALIATATGTLAALALARMRPSLARGLTGVLALPVLLPPLVVAIAIVVFVVRGLGLPLGVPVVVLSHVLVTQPFVVLVLLARLERFDPAAIEAARDLGATPWQAFRRVMLPQIASALVGGGLIAAALSLDDFVIASFTLGGGNTLSTFVWGQMRTTLDPSINAIATILLGLTLGLAALALRLSRWRG
jgi:spermidine/putrescine transport system permease protein